ncbi:MAG: hypothetical protein NTV86_04010 [Planctomycetota bacterium]|nr:hypothetical protein [Planctomycetota bacterium]
MRRRSISARCSSRRREGAVYALVLIVAMLLSLMAMAGISVNRVNARSGGDGGDWAEAKMLAYSGAEHAMAKINTDANWRTNFNGTTCTMSMGRGTFAWHLVDEADGSLTDDPTENFVILSTGAVGNTSYTLRVTMKPPASALIYGLCAQSTIDINDRVSIDSFDSTLGDYGGTNIGSNATVGTNTTAYGGVSIEYSCKIKGSVKIGVGGNVNYVINTGGWGGWWGSGGVTGSRTALTQPIVMPTLTEPTTLGATTGNLSTSTNQTLVISSNRHVTNLTLGSGSTVQISGNVTILADGPVTLYPNSQIQVLTGGSLVLYFKNSLTVQNDAVGMQVVGPNLSRLQLLSLGTGTITIGQSVIEGVIIAPNSTVNLTGDTGWGYWGWNGWWGHNGYWRYWGYRGYGGADVFGAIVAKYFHTYHGGELHQDTRITSGLDPVNIGSSGPVKPKPIAWSQVVQ